jgi:hypothetical protein
MIDNKKSVTSRLNDTVKNIEKKQTNIKRMITNFKKQECSSNPCAALIWIQANIDILQNEDPGITQVAKQIEDYCKDLLLRFEADLKDNISSNNFILSGQWPTYYINHLIPVIINERKYSISVGEEEIQSLDLVKLIESLKKQSNNLKITGASLKKFLNELYDTCEKITPTGNHSIAIWNVYRNMVINKQSKTFWRDASNTKFRAFRILEFRAYLTELLKANLTTVSNCQLRLLPPISRDESMYIYQPSEDRFCNVGRIEFCLIGDSGNA